MGGVPRRVDHREGASADRDPRTIGEEADPVGGARQGLAVHRSHASLSIGSSRAGDQPPRVHQVRRSALVHPERGGREPLEESAGSTSMIDVDVRDDQVCEVRGADPERFERGQYDGPVRAGTGLDQGRFPGRQEIHGVQFAFTHHRGVDRGDAGGHLAEDRLPRVHGAAVWHSRVGRGR